MRAIGPYEVLALLGRGSNGTVVLARRPGVERMFAIKLLEGGLDPEGLARLRREAEIASRLEHPGIVQVHDVGVHDQRPYLVMDHVPGPTLAAVIEREGAMSSRRAARLVADIAEAIDAAHRAGVVHRDLKPANVIVDGRDGRPKVTDFGLARDLSRPSDLTQPGVVLGTPYYMAPEQVRGERVDARADVWALGVILYELLAGARPFEAASVSELGWKILRGAPPPPSSRRPDVDPRVEAVCMAALSPSRDARPASARALAEALAEATREAPVAARRAGGGRVAPAALVAAAGALVALGLAAWALAERRQAAATAREARATLARAEALAAAPGRARAARERVAALEAEVARLEGAAREAARALEEARAADLDVALERARFDGHLAQVVDRAIATLEGVPGADGLVADLLRCRGRYEEGLAACARARAAAPDDIELVVLELRLHLGAGHRDRAMAALDELLRLAPPEGAHGLFARGVLAASRGDVATALQYADRALVLSPRTAYLHLMRSTLLRMDAEKNLRVDRLRDAAEAASRAIELDPINPDAYGERADTNLTLALVAPETAPEMATGLLQDLRIARELRPEPKLWADAAMIYVLVDEPLAALAEAQVALERAGPRWAAAARTHVWRGHALALLGHEEEAVAAWRQGGLAQEPVSTASLHARWLGLVSESARARALEGATDAFRSAVEAAVRAGS